METELRIQGVGFPPLSARGCKQKLWTIGGDHHRRTLLGNLVFVGVAFKKYRTMIEGEDQTVLTTDGVLLPGVSVEVDCIQRLWQPVLKETTNVTLTRPFVNGSLIFPGSYTHDSSKDITIEPSKEDRFLSYRPRLSMMIIRYELITHEWDFKTKWILEMEEV